MLRIGLALCGALEHAHGRGVVHRDVKPQNVLIPDAPRSAAGVAKLADFGVAHLAGDEPLTRTGDVVGTLAYMAPEQAAGKRIDERCDIYSLALVLYEALAGSNPVRAGSPAATARRVGTVLPPLRRARKDLPEELCAAIDRALRPKPDERGHARRPRRRARGVAAGGLRRRRDRRAAPARAHRAVRLAAARRRPRASAPRSRAGSPPRRSQWAGQPLLGALAAVAAVAIFPRLGWLAVTVATVAMLSTDRAGAAVLVAAAVVPVPLLLRRRGTAWSVPALAPLLGLAGARGRLPRARRARPRPADPAGARRARRLVDAARRPAARRELLGGGGNGPPVISDPSTLGDALTRHRAGARTT